MASLASARSAGTLLARRASAARVALAPAPPAPRRASVLARAGAGDDAERAKRDLGRAGDDAASMARKASDETKGRTEQGAREARDFVSDKAEGAHDSAADAAHEAQRRSGEAFRDAKGGAQEASDRVQEAGEDVAGRTRGAASDVRRAGEDAARGAGDRAEGVGDQIKSAAENVKESAKETAESARDAVNDAATAASDKIDDMRQGVKDTMTRVRGPRARGRACSFVCAAVRLCVRGQSAGLRVRSIPAPTPPLSGCAHALTHLPPNPNHPSPRTTSLERRNDERLPAGVGCARRRATLAGARRRPAQLAARARPWAAGMSPYEATRACSQSPARLCYLDLSRMMPGHAPKPRLCFAHLDPGLLWWCALPFDATSHAAAGPSRFCRLVLYPG
ncbi:MAG: hypothetical protein J3K34DRAFT_253337 [Monoraphidium minutum]|nr:MAG: hypothetical protein J3K34DRAFT_253337 [Monoraphidium minutum]